MRAWRSLAWVELKLYFREPIAAFFTLVFPPGMLFLFGSIFGNRPTPMFGGFGSVDISVPAYTSMIIGSSGLITIPALLSNYRELGVLRRLHAAPVRTHAILLALVAVVLAMTAKGMVLLVVSGRLAYGIRFAGWPLSVAAAFMLCAATFFAVGFALAGVLTTARTTLTVSQVVFFPMMFLSGSAIPREVLPEGVRSFSQAIPLTHVVTLMRGLWAGDGWGDYLPQVGILVGVLAASLVVSAKTFKWE